MILPETLLYDARYGVRMLYRNAGSTAVAVLALALGIGINTAVFTAYKAMIARPLDARNPAEMVNLALTRDSGATGNTFSYPDYESYRDSVHSFSGLVAFRLARVTLSNAGSMISQRAAVDESAMGKLGLLRPATRHVEFASVAVVSENYFKVLGVAPLHGRTFDATPSVLISENYWTRRFAADPTMLGKTIHLNGIAVTIAGIAPHDFVGTSIGAPAFWLPAGIEPLINADNEWLHERENQRYRLFGRLAPGVTIRHAQAEMSMIADRVRTLHDPHSDSAKAATALVWPGSPFPLPLKRYGGLRLAIILTMAAAAMVLAVACANVGSLQLARARSRQNELRTRLSLGASRLRIISQLVTETALVGLLAGALALLFTWALLKLAVIQLAAALPPDEGSLVFDVTPDLKIFIYVFAISLFAGMLSGLTPAMDSSRSALLSAGRAGTTSVSSRRLQDLLVAAQVALSLVLMIVASMFIRSSIYALKTATGYDSRHVINVEVQFPEQKKYTAERERVLVGRLQERLAALPGVVAISSARPPADRRFRTAVVSSEQKVQAILSFTYVQANYFRTLGIPVLLGRGFQVETGQAERAVILSESAAQQLWPHQNPIGRSLRLGPIDEHIHQQSELLVTGPAYQVVGVARDKRGVEFDGSDTREMYLQLAEPQLASRPILIRTQSDPAPVIREIDQVISSIDPDLIVTSSTLEQMLRQSTPFLASSLAAAIASTIGFFGLLLALMGIYGTVSYIVVLRTREVGIRMAIGAQKRNVLGLILRESARPVLAGLFAGMLVATGASYIGRGLVYGLSGVDGMSVVGVSLLFLVIALLASYSPARRAMRVDPMVALRCE